MKRSIFAVALLVLFLSVAAPPALAQAPYATGEMEVHIWPGVEPGQILIIVGVTVPESVRLPVTVRLPVVPGSNVSWAGEISSSGTASADVAAQPEIKKGKGGNYAEFEVTQYRHAQIELGGISYGQSGSVVAGDVEWVQSVPASLTGFAVRVPATAADLKIDPQPSGPPTRNSAGESLFTLPSKVMKPGDTTSISFSYDTRLPRTKAPMDASSRMLLILGGLIAAALAVLAVLLLRQRRLRPAAYVEPSELADSEDEEDPDSF